MSSREGLRGALTATSHRAWLGGDLLRSGASAATRLVSETTVIEQRSPIEILEMMVERLYAEEPEDAVLTFASAHGFVLALVAVERLTWSEASTWRERIGAGAPDVAAAVASKVVEGGRWSATMRAVTTRPRQATPGEVNLPQPFNGRRLLRLFLLSPQALDELELTALEVYDDGVAVRWHRRTAAAAPLPSQIELFDDIGTAYQSIGVYAAGIRRDLQRGEKLFGPAPPVAAKLLRIRGDRHEVAVSLV